MTAQFPQSELQSYETYLALLKSEKYCFFKALDDQKEVGYCLLYKEDSKDFLWLDYIAVFKEFHSCGYGKKIISDLALNFPQYKGVYLEVEKPDDEAPDTIRRIRFYENLGAQRLDIVYFYPNAQDCVALDLYFLPFNSPVPSSKEAIEAVTCAFGALHSHLPHYKEVLKKIK